MKKLIVLCLAGLLLFATYIWDQARVYEDLKLKTLDQMDHIANQTNQALNDFMAGFEDIVNQKPILESLISEDFDGFDHFLEDLDPTYLKTYAVTNDQGIIIHDFGRDLTGLDISSRLYIKENREKLVSHVSDLILSKVDNRLSFVISVPLLVDGHYQYSILVSLDYDFIKDHYKDLIIGDKAYVYLVDAKGLIMDHPNKGWIGQMNLLELDETLTDQLVDHLGHYEVFDLTYTIKGEDQFSVFRRVGPWYLVTNVSK